MWISRRAEKRSVRSTVMIAGMAVAGMVLSGCAAPFLAADGTSAGEAQGPEASQTAAAAEVPGFTSELERVCAEGLGFPGLPAYKRSDKGVHPAVIMTKKADGDSWSQGGISPGDYPDGWIVDYSGDAGTTQLVLCYERTSATPNGKICSMEDRDTKETYDMKLYNTTYLLRVLDARTGKALLEHKGKARSTTCPMLTFFSKGDDRTKYYIEATPKDYRAIVKRYLST